MKFQEIKKNQWHKYIRVFPMLSVEHPHQNLLGFLEEKYESKCGFLGPTSEIFR